MAGTEVAARPSFELARVSSDGLVVTVDTAGGQDEWEVKLRKLR